MKIKLITIGSVREKAIASAIETYSSRIGHYWPFELTDLPDVRLPRGVERFLARIDAADFLVLFDERGREMTSRQFADFISRKAVELQRNLVFLIGGPYGFSHAVYARANALLSLSKMTFPHELVRLFAVEQLYRAGTISRGEPYHHD